MPLNAAIQRIQRLMGFNGVLTDGAGGSAQTDLSNLVGLDENNSLRNLLCPELGP